MADAQTTGWLARAALEVVLNGLWIGGAVALASFGVGRLTRRASAATRYGLWLAALAAILLLPVASSFSRPNLGPSTPAAALVRADDTPVDESIAGPRVDATVPAPVAPVVEVRSGRWTSWLLAALAAAWIAGLARIVLGVAAIVRYRCRCVPLDAARAARLAEWNRHVNEGRSARLCVSPDAPVPMVLGLWRPVVAIPCDLADVLSDGELDQIALHELAHVRRRDDWAKLAQSLLEAVCFYHPATWWLSRRVDTEREVACDDWVLSVTRAPRRYARCLLRLAELKIGPSALPAPGALGRKPAISDRIERVLVADRDARPRASWRWTWSVAAALGVVTLWCTMTGPAVAISALPLSFEVGEAASVPVVSVASERDASAAAAAALGDRTGTVVVMDPRTGRVLAVVNEDWAVRRTFPPASTIKLVTAFAGLGAGTLDPSERLSAQGERVNLVEAMARSNTEYFQRQGERAGFERFIGLARAFGYGEPTGVNLAGEAAGRLPHEGDAGVPDRVFGIGMGFEVTPMQLAAMVSAIGNGGTLLAPHADGSDEPRVRRRIDISDTDRRRVVDSMIETVRTGTGRPAAVPGLSVAGKTGTIDGPEGGTGLFVSFAPADAPRLAVVVVTQGKGVLGRTAAGIAGGVYRRLLRGSGSN